MKRTILALLAALAFAAPAWADDAAPTKPSEAQIAAAMDLMDANGSIANMSAMLDSMAPIESLMMRRQQPNISSEQIATIQTKIKNAFLSHIGELKQLVAIAYAQHFTEDELHTLAAFYRSETGRKYVTTVPAMLKELSPVETAWAMRIAQEVVEDMAKSAHNTGEHT